MEIVTLYWRAIWDELYARKQLTKRQLVVSSRRSNSYRVTHQPSPWMGDFSHLLMTPVSGSLSELSLFHAQSSYRPEESLFLLSKLT